MSVTTEFRPLHLVEQLSEEIGSAISYAYDDLIFFEHSAILVQFDTRNAELLHLFINSDVTRDKQESIQEHWMQVARTKNISLDFKGTFSVEQIPGKEEISIRFN